MTWPRQVAASGGSARASRTPSSSGSVTQPGGHTCAWSAVAVASVRSMLVAFAANRSPPKSTLPAKCVPMKPPRVAEALEAPQIGRARERGTGEVTPAGDRRAPKRGDLVEGDVAETRVPDPAFAKPEVLELRTGQRQVDVGPETVLVRGPQMLLEDVLHGEAHQPLLSRRVVEPYSSVTRRSLASCSFCSRSNSTYRCLRAASSNAAAPPAPMTRLPAVRTASSRRASTRSPEPRNTHSNPAATTATTINPTDHNTIVRLDNARDPGIHASFQRQPHASQQHRHTPGPPARHAAIRQPPTSPSPPAPVKRTPPTPADPRHVTE